MLNKFYILSLLLFIKTRDHYENKEIHGKNKVNIEKNIKNIKTSKDQLNRQIRESEEHYKNIENLHNEIKNKGSDLNHTKYNELVKKYSVAVKKYNDKRKNMCAELPPLWALQNKKHPESDKEYYCRKWTYMAFEFGTEYGKALFYLGKHTIFPDSLKKHLYCTGSIFFNITSNNSIHNYYKNCFYRNFQERVKYTIDSLRNGKMENLVLKNPFKNIQNKEKEVKELIDNVKRVLGDFGKNAYFSRYYVTGKFDPNWRYHKYDN